ncbi:hypothetical protein KFK09_006191 [Dendrobium nobile]|uniref:Uncharacterized protein n=1 Tax=Dendrobium nobile TaxID=94219 RepID=A0A8T3BNA4_DENNO|nr:hypothetical protein KFK09_006191 [Dendrobium nobile]
MKPKTIKQTVNLKIKIHITELIKQLSKRKRRREQMKREKEEIEPCANITVNSK